MTNKIVSKPIVKLKIVSGPVTPHQRAAWRRFWQRLIAEAKREAKNG